jgi:hypothetical protein
MFTKYIVLFLSLAASASALASPHISVNVHHHRALAGRAASLASGNVPSVGASKRRLTKRCKPQHNAPSSVSSTTPPTMTPNVNAAPSPSSSASSTSTHETPKAAAVTKPAEPKPAPPSDSGKQPGGNQPGGNQPGGNQPSFMDGTQTGQGTFYSTGLGACGITNNDGDFIAAVSHLLFDQYPGYQAGNSNRNPICNKQIRATYQGKSVTVTVTDRCEGCAQTDLDFSPAAFNTIANPSQGRISGMTWVWA